MNNEDKATLHYLRNSPSDALKREAAVLIEKQDLEIEILRRLLRAKMEKVMKA